LKTVFFNQTVATLPPSPIFYQLHPNTLFHLEAILNNKMIVPSTDEKTRKGKSPLQALCGLFLLNGSSGKKLSKSTKDARNGSSLRVPKTPK
jgi:hypothetical protein